MIARTDAGTLRLLLAASAAASLACPVMAQEKLKEREPRDASAPKEQRAPEMDQMFQRMFDAMEQRFGIDVPRHTFFEGDFLRNLREQVEGVEAPDLREFEGTGRAMSLKIDQDGVVAELERTDESGKVRTKTYRAKSIEKFREQFPDVARRLNLSGRGAPDPGDGWLPLSSYELVPTSDKRESDGAPDGERLGVLVRRAISADLREFLGLHGGQGLLVAKVFEDTLATRLGLEPMDVVLEINGEAIGSTRDVRRALAATEPGSEVAVVVNRRCEKTSLKATKPEEADADSASAR